VKDTAERLLAALFPLQWNEADERREIVAQHLSGLSEGDVIDVCTRALGESLDINQAMLAAMRNHPAALRDGLLQFGRQRQAQRNETTNKQFARIVAGFDYE